NHGSAPGGLVPGRRRLFPETQEGLCCESKRIHLRTTAQRHRPNGVQLDAMAWFLVAGFAPFRGRVASCNQNRACEYALPVARPGEAARSGGPVAASG